MNVLDVLGLLNENEIGILDNILWDKPKNNCLYGTFEVESKIIKNEIKDEIHLGGYYSLFVAHMYSTNKPLDEQFFYLKFYRLANKRQFRKHSFHPIEYNKIFVTGKTPKDLVDNFKLKLVGYSLK